MRVLVIGAGRMGALRAADLATDERVEEIVIANRSRDRADVLAREVGGTAVPLEAIPDVEAEAIVLTTASTSHADLLLELLTRGTPILCEKPIALTLDDTDRVIAAAHAHGTLVQVGFQRRFDPGFARARAAIASGALGTTYAIHAMSHDHLPSSVEFMSGAGDIFTDLLVHDLDLVHWLTGSPIATVYATLAVRVHTQYGTRTDGVVDGDVALVHAVLADGTQVAITGTRHDPVGHDVRMEIFGSADSLAMGLTSRTPLHPQDGALALDVDPFRGFVDRFRPAFHAETRAFLDTATGLIPNPCTMADARAALHAAVCCGESVARQAPVRVLD